MKKKIYKIYSGRKVLATSFGIDEAIDKAVLLNGDTIKRKEIYGNKLETVWSKNT